MKNDRTYFPTSTGLCYNNLHYNILNFLRSINHLVHHSVVFFTVLSFNQRSPPPEFLSARRRLERTHSITSVLACHGISLFSPDEDSCINCRNVGKFLTCFYVFSASRARLKFVCCTKFQHTETLEDLKTIMGRDRFTSLASMTVHTNRPTNNEDIFKTLLQLMHAHRALESIH